jgi:hypothetical protein
LAEKRLRKMLQAKMEQKKEIQKILSPIVNQEEGNLELSISMKVPLPVTQSLSSYYSNLHRDWGWEDSEENRLSLEFVREALQNVAKSESMLVLGSGASRLPFDLHQSLGIKRTLAIDINPLLLYSAKKIIDGQKISLYEFPSAPKTLESVAIKRRLSAPQPLAKDSSFSFAFADALNPPVKPGTYSWIMTPWFIDIVPADIHYTLSMINFLLPEDGLWIQFGPISFQRNQPELCYSPEEFRGIVKGSGFEIIYDKMVAIPYLQSPDSFRQRTENIAVIVARKEKAMSRPKKYQFTPDWLSSPDLPIENIPALQSSFKIHEISAKFLHWIDGRRSLNDLASLFSSEYKVSQEHALGSISHFLLQHYQMIKQPPMTRDM